MFGRNNLKQQYICGRLGTYVSGHTVISLVIVYSELKEKLSADKRSVENCLCQAIVFILLL